MYHLWTHRNSILHESQSLGSLSGLTSFCIAIAAELATHTRADVSAPCLLPIFQYNIGDSSSTKTTSTETMVPCHPAWSWSNSHQHNRHLLNKCFSAQVDWPSTHPNLNTFLLSLSSCFHLGTGCVTLLAWTVLYSTRVGQFIQHN